MEIRRRENICKKFPDYSYIETPVHNGSGVKTLGMLEYSMVGNKNTKYQQLQEFNRIPKRVSPLSKENG